MFRIEKKVANAEDGLHCTQACLIMLLDAFGHSMTMQEADQATGFRSGRETWPYGMIAWLARNGFEVIHIDALDAGLLAVDPRRELVRSGLDTETIDYFLKISDFPAEARYIKDATDSGNVVFESKIPNAEVIPEYIEFGWLPMVSLDATVLAGGVHEEFDGHIVLVTSADHNSLLLQDPGPPSRWDWTASIELLSKSMRSPADTSGTLTLVRPKH